MENSANSSNPISPEYEKHNITTRGGPHDLGDPNDLRLRKVEREVLIPMKMRDKAKTERCIQEVSAFNECCKNSGIGMVIKCRSENSQMKACLTKWYQDPVFQKECENEYLKERSEYRRTGIKKKHKKYEA